MKNRIMKVVATVAMMSVMTMGLVGCGGSDNASTNEDSAKKTEDTSSVESEAKDDNTSLSGKISLAGSTSMEKVCEGLSESFMEAYPGITVTVEYTGSGAGLESLAAGSVDIGNSSRKLSDEEKAAGSVENVIALDGIAVITDSENKVKDISSEDLAKGYKGEITNWSELGGDDEAIVVVGRESGSGTRGAFEELLDIEDACNYAQELDSTGAVLAKVMSTPGAIGYVSLDVVDDTVTALTLDGVEASEENILAEKYSLSRPFVMATKGEISEQNELVKTWFDYIDSEEGQEVISGAGLILPQ